MWFLEKKIKAVRGAGSQQPERSVCWELPPDALRSEPGMRAGGSLRSKCRKPK